MTGLPSDSIALLDQLRAVDIERIAGQVGSVPPETLEAVRATLRTLLAPS